MVRWSKPKLVFAALGLLTAVVLIFQWWTGSPATAPVAVGDTSGGGYAALTPDQRLLIDDFTARFDKATGKQVEAGVLYDALALSTKTTFKAITHALSKTPLSDTDGQPLKLTALDLVARIDAIAGSIPDAGGDQQFRMYVQLRPDTQQILERSREFARQVDNTMYHKGYPICFRGSGGTPSIQFSLSPDGARGDIDVDYRASAFPIMLINGHLTASNSDVRAGNNDERHNGHWSGLENWWQGFMGLVLGEFTSAEAASAARSVSSEPRLGKGTKPEEAIADFLRAWLVEQNPGVAAGYVAPRAFACLEVERGVPVDRGVARFQMVAAMQQVNRRLGQVNDLSDAIEGVSLTSPRGKEVTQPHRNAFVMYDVREDLAQALDCETRLRPEGADPQQARSTSFGNYIVAAFRLKAAGASGDAVATLWTRDNDVWTLVAYAAEPELKPGALPSAPPAEPVAARSALPVVEGDPNLLRAVADFYNAWLVQKDHAAAFRQLSPQSYSCYNAFRIEDAPPTATQEEGGRRILDGMRRAAELVGPATRLEDLINGVEPHHPDLRLVKHESAAAFTIAAIPDAMGAALACDRLKPGVAPRPDRDGLKEYGTFYAASTRFTRAGADGAVLWTVWAKSGSTSTPTRKVRASGAPAWQVVSYLVIAA